MARGGADHLAAPCLPLRLGIRFLEGQGRGSQALEQAVDATWNAWNFFRFRPACNLNLFIFDQVQIFALNSTGTLMRRREPAPRSFRLGLSEACVSHR